MITDINVWVLSMWHDQWIYIFCPIRFEDSVVMWYKSFSALLCAIWVLTDVTEAQWTFFFFFVLFNWGACIPFSLQIHSAAPQSLCSSRSDLLGKKDPQLPIDRGATALLSVSCPSFFFFQNCSERPACSQAGPYGSDLLWLSTPLPWG